MQTQKVWIVDDEVELTDTYQDILSGTFPLRAFNDPAEVLKAYEKETPPDLLITDIKMPGMTGIELIEELRRRKFQNSIIVISGFAEKEHAIQALSLGVFGLIEKPFHRNQFRHMVFRAVAYSSLMDMTEKLLMHYDVLQVQMKFLLDRTRDRYIEAENKLDEKKLPAADRNKILQYMRDIVQESHLETDVEKARLEIQAITEKRDFFKSLVLEVPKKK